MKTLKSKNRTAKNGISLLIAAMLPLFILVSCQKTEEPMPVSNEASHSNLRLSNQPEVPFTLIEIDHQALRSHLPDYKVTVQSNGMIIFEGRRNVTVMGKRYFEVPKSTLIILEEIFKEDGFYAIQSHLVLHPDAPYVLTSFRMYRDARLKTLADDNSNPESLIRIRSAVEEVLEIQRYVHLKLPGASNNLAM
ncbi:MAG: DUF6438 domain-containing protein [Bacteroidia bacterium]